jgi:hypothetical protein
VKNDPKEITVYKSRYKLDDEIKFIMEHYELHKCKHPEQLPETIIEKLQNKYKLSQQLVKRYPPINNLHQINIRIMTVQINY